MTTQNKMPLKNVTNRNLANRAGDTKKVFRQKDVLSKEERALFNAREADDAKDISMYHEYATQVFSCYLDNERSVLPDPSYMIRQEELKWSMRSLLVDWTIDVHLKLNLVPETLYLSVNLIDRFLSSRTVSISKLQLVGVTALLIASKYEEVVCPSIETFVLITDNALTEEEIRKAEKYMLHVLDYRMEYPSPLNFLRKCSKTNNYEVKSRMLAKYIMELTLLYEKFIKYPGSIIAASSFYLARKILKNEEFNNLFFLYCGYSFEDIEDCVNNILSVISEPIIYEHVQRKYASSKMMKASVFVKEYFEINYNKIKIG